GFYTHDGVCRVSEGTREAVEAAAACFADAEEVEPPDVSEATELFFALMAADGGEQARRDLAPAAGRHVLQLAALLENLQPPARGHGARPSPGRADRRESVSRPRRPRRGRGGPLGMTLLVAEGIHKRYGGVHALRGASLEVHAGEVHALIGENGSGKSTLLKILSGQLHRDAGEIVFDGSRIATVTQETTLAPDLSIAENVFLGHRMARRGALIDWRATRRGARN